MDSGAVQKLTSRQQSVMERIDRRVPIKVIANELGVSETRINQHIRALKDIYQAESLNELVDCYRALHPEGQVAPDSALQGEDEPYRKPEYSKKQLTNTSDGIDESPRVDDRHQSAGSHAPALQLLGTGADQSEPRIVPGVLDGEHAVLLRLAVIIGIAFGILAAVVLSVTAALALSEAMDGMVSVPVEN